MGIFNFFKKKEAKAPSRKSNPNSDSMFHKASTGWMNVSDSIENPYEENIWVYSAVKAISTNIAGVPFKLRDKRTQKEIEDPNHPFLKLFNAPHSLLDKSQLWKATSIHYEVDGTCFWLLLNAYDEFLTSPKDIPTTILPVSCNRIKPRFNDDAQTQFIGWAYIKDFRFPDDAIPLEFYQIVRFYEYNPKSLLKGFSGLTPADVSIDVDYKAHIFNQKFFENGTDIGGVLMYTGEDMEDHAMQAVRDRWDDRYKGFDKKGKTAVLSGGWSYEKNGTTHRDMDYEKLLKMSREEIIATLNVPKHQVSLYEDTNYATAKVADAAFWQNKLIPTMNYFASALNRHMFQFSNVEAFFDFSGVDALKESLAEKLASAEILKNLGYPLNEINAKLNLGMEVIKEKWADEPTNMDESPDNDGNDNGDKPSVSDDDDKSVPNGHIHKEKNIIDNTIKGLHSEKSDTSSTSSQVYELTKSLLSEAYFDPKDLSLKEMIELSIAGNQIVIDAMIKNYEEDVIEPVLDPFIKRMNGYFMKLQKAQLKRFDNATKSVKKELTEEEVNDMLFNSKEWNEILKDTAKPYHTEAFERSIKRIEVELGGFNLFDPTGSTTGKALSEVVNKIKGINVTIKNQIRDTLVDGLNKGESTFQLRDRIRHQFKNALSRVNTITRTETGIAANRARGLAMAEEKVWKKWSSSNDKFVRDSHINYNRLSAMPMSKEYAPGLKHPQDVNCSDAGEVVNCRCLILAVRPPKN